MATNSGSAKIRSGVTLLGVGSVCLLLTYVFFAAPERDNRAVQPAPAVTPQTASLNPADRREPENKAETAPPVFATTTGDQGTEDAAAQPASRLQEAELEHLREVFQNSVAPSFQYDFTLDREGRAAIDAFVASMPEHLGREDLDTLSSLIERELSTAEAEDLAFIITHLYGLEQAEARLMKDLGPVTTMADQQEAQARLTQLREEWFGPELSARLFADTDDGQPENGTAADDSTTERGEPRTEAQAELAEFENAWAQRYQAFQAEKRLIDNAGLDQAEKDRQIEILLQQHYAPGERDAARAFDQQRP